jgi:hypothetical protein
VAREQLGTKWATRAFNGVKDEALVSEAMRLQRERVYDQGDLWRVLSAADPERALRALKLEADAGRFEPVAWRDLLWAVCDKRGAELQFEVAALLLNTPAATLEELLAPTASWLQSRRESLKSDPSNEALLLRIWDRLAALAYPQVSAPIDEVEKDLTSSALGDPAGTLALTFLDHAADQQPAPNEGLHREYSRRLTLAVSAPGRAGFMHGFCSSVLSPTSNQLILIGRQPTSCPAFPGTGNTLGPCGARLPAADTSVRSVCSTL